MFSENTSQASLNFTNSSGSLTTLDLVPAAQALTLAVLLVLFSTSILGNSLLIILALSAGKRIIATAVYLVGLGILNLVISLQLLVGSANTAGRGVVVGDTLCKLSAVAWTAIHANYLLNFCTVCDLVVKMLNPTRFSLRASRNASIAIVSITLVGVALYIILNMSLVSVAPTFYLILPENRPFSICNEWATPSMGDSSEMSAELMWLVSVAAILGSTAVGCIAMVKILLIRRRRQQIRKKLKRGIIGITKMSDFQVNLKRQVRIATALGCTTTSQLVLGVLYHLTRIPVSYRGGQIFALDLAGMLSIHLVVHIGLVIVMTSKVFRGRIKRLRKFLQCQTFRQSIPTTCQMQQDDKSRPNSISRWKELKVFKSKRIHPTPTVSERSAQV